MSLNILFVCTDNFTRSVIAEFCMKDYLSRNNIESMQVASAGIRANSNISMYSTLHFEIMQSMEIDTSDFKRTPLELEHFDEYDLVIGMSELHREYINKEFNKTIPLFNEIYNGSSKPVNIGPPDRVDLKEGMKKLVEYFYYAMPNVYENIQTDHMKEHN